MICPRSLVLNGTFREFSDGFEELGIPRTGSVPPLSPTPFSPPVRFLLSFCLSRSSFRADSIKRLFVAVKRRVKRFVRDASHLSPSSPSHPSSLLSPFPLRSPFPSASSVFSVPLCYAPLPPPSEIYKRERAFQGRAGGSSSNGEQFGR